VLRVEFVYLALCDVEQIKLLSLIRVLIQS